jgi:hypothetical protein
MKLSRPGSTSRPRRRRKAMSKSKNWTRMHGGGVAAAVLSAVLYVAVAIPSTAEAAPKRGTNNADLNLTGYGPSQPTGYGPSQPVGVGEVISFNFWINNNGPGIASNVKLKTSFDAAHIEFVKADLYGSGPCTESLGALVCDFGSLEPAGGTTSSGGATVYLRPLVEGVTTTVNATASSGTQDPSSANNSVSFSFPIYFVKGCSGFVAASELSPPWNNDPSRYSCTRSFTLTAPRTLQLEISPLVGGMATGFRGLLEASVSNGSVKESVRAFYTNGQAVGTTSKEVTLAPGDWRLSVGTIASSANPIPWFGGHPLCLDPQLPVWFPRVCLPVSQPSVGWFIAAGEGWYYGQVIAR